MNDFFDRLGAAAKRAAGTVGTEVSIAAEEQKIRESYQALGKLYYHATAAGRMPNRESCDVHCRRIEESLKRIQQLRDGNNVTGEPYADEADFVDAEPDESV